VAEPTALTTLADGPFMGRQIRISNPSRPFVLRDNGKAAVYLYRSKGIHRFKGWCDIIDLDRRPPVPVREVQVVDEIHHWHDEELEEKREQIAALKRGGDGLALSSTARRRGWWRRLWDRLFPTPLGGSDV
jgi:hypothetical protein